MKKIGMNEITTMQYIMLIHGSQVGTGVFSLPRKIAESSGTDGWVSIILAWCMNTLAGCVILLVLRQYPDLTLPDLFKKLFGRWLGKLLIIPLSIYFALFGFLVLVNSMLYIKAWFLQKTPGYLIVLLFAVPTYLILRNGLRVLARYVELVFYMMIWMPFIILFPLGDAYWIHLLPLFKDGWGQVMNGIFDTMYSFAGMEALLIIYPFLRNKRYAFQGLFIANTMTMFLYLFVTIICFSFFPLEEIMILNQPLLSLLKNIEFRFIERFDMVILALYLFIVSRVWMIYIFSSIFSISQVFGKQNHKYFALIFLALVVGIVYFHQPTWNESNLWTEQLSRLSIVVIYVLPVVLLLYVKGYEWFQRRKTG